MKLISIFLILLISASNVYAEKKLKKTPYQLSLQSCFGKKLDTTGIDTNNQLYSAIEKSYPLISSQTLYREVSYVRKGDRKKLKYEDSVLRVYAVSDDDTLALVSSESLNAPSADNKARQSILTPEARLNQILFGTDIKSDFMKTQETRAGQLSLVLSWTDGALKNLNAEFSADSDHKKTLICMQKESADICICRN